MVRRTEDCEPGPVIVPIDDGTDTYPAAVQAWLAGLSRHELVEVTVWVAEIVREIREHGAA